MVEAAVVAAIVEVHGVLVAVVRTRMAEVCREVLLQVPSLPRSGDLQDQVHRVLSMVSELAAAFRSLQLQIVS